MKQQLYRLHVLRGGVTTYTCETCKYYYEIKTDALGHKWDDGVIAKEASYSEAGIKTYTCSNCGETRNEEIPILVVNQSQYNEYINKYPNYSGSFEEWKNDFIANQLDIVVSFDVNYGTSIDSINLKKGEILDLNNYFTEQVGYSFLGWYLDKDHSLEADYNFSSMEDCTLYAKFEIDNLEIPSIEIFTENNQEIVSKDEYVSATASLSNASDDYCFNEVSCQICGRGNSTWAMAKKPYKIKFDKKRSMLGSSYKAKKWVLLANYADKSLSRNALAYEMAKQMNDIVFSSMHEFVDVYINNGYQGVYLLCDQMEEGTGRVDLDESMDSSTGETSFLIERDARAMSEGSENIDYFYSNNGHSFGIKYPKTDEEEYLSNASLYCSYIKSCINNGFSALDSNNWDNVQSLFDVESFAQTYIIQELFANNDCGYSSFYLYKDISGKLTAGPVWDFDIGAGNVNYGMGNSEECKPDAQLWANNANTYYNKLLKYDQFKEMVVTDLNKYSDKLLDIILLSNPDYKNGYYQLYKASLERNFTRWDIMGSYVWPEPESVYTLETVKEQMQYLYNWLTIRLSYLKTIYF